MQKILRSEKFIVIAILVIGLLSFGFIVYSDTASTSVTVGNATPTITSLSFNGGNNLTLNENTFVLASTTMTVTDTNGCSDITSVTAQFYLASSSNSGTTCTYDGEDCYTTEVSCSATTTGNTCTGGADTSAQYDCGFTIWYTAHPTDASAPTFSADIWSVSATTTDGTDTSSATNTAETIEVVTLNALNVTGTISYPTTAANSDTGATNQSVYATSTGNTAIDFDLSGTDMCDGGVCPNGYFVSEQQKYGLTDVTYASLTALPATTTSAVTVQANLSKPVSTTSPSTNTATTTYWGVGIPSGQASGSYTGTNTFTAVSD